MGLLFYPDQYAVARGHEQIALLPKEYALLFCLYESKNRSLSRAELLDRVWGLEEPTDRTVDDHIYRLRKKLLRWNDILRIETVRGYGYRLHLAEPFDPPAPLPQLTENVHQLLQTYHGLGMGGAMQILSEHHQLLGADPHPFYSVYLHFVTGDFHWIADADELPLWEKLIYLLHLHWMIKTEPNSTLELCLRLLQKRENLPGNWATELQINLVTMYAETKQFAQAAKQLDLAEQETAVIRSDSFTLHLLFAKSYLALLENDTALAKQWIDQARQRLDAARQPYQREEGLLALIRGLWLYQTGNIPAARETVDSGYQILLHTRFIPHLLQGIRHLCFFLHEWRCDAEWLDRYQKRWQQYVNHFRLMELEPKIDRLFARSL
ncbi:winged helix-turn-helix domain-containing protein [Brevibacillus fulvus]|uniref:OmpR/PhoB-type domain-containing protein n=1 Tax=Brevibacillus fulvus TaxID=1125967 RepID=A0A939BT78_9BACL|nr:winged helix-turn-helix domain-containing protein [Brevibacillus fulvus]MBM7591243.1 hypothetical protein [Brevibacillus fulvus]